MTAEDADAVKDRLRGAVFAGVIWGWYRHLPLKGKEWVVNPMSGPCVSYSCEDITAFCGMLEQSGVSLYSQSK